MGGRGVRPAAAVALLVAAAAWARLASPARAGDTHEDIARGLLAPLAERGRPVDLARLRIEVRELADTQRDILRQQEVLLPDTYFDGMAAFFHALDRTPLKGRALAVADFRAVVVRGLAEAVPAYYQPGEGRLVFRSAGERTLLTTLENRRHLVAHELVHAHQDQVRPYAERFREARRTTEGSRILSCVLEGEAEVVALSLGLDLANADPAGLTSDIERMLDGERMLLYATGRTFIARRYREGGWDAVTAAVTAPPPSTEQLLHAAKWRTDTPSIVALPALDMRVVHDDVLGELEIRSLLGTLGANRDEAFLAAAGWDGDRLLVLQEPEGEGRTLIWRTLWDRVEDAEQFADVLGRRAAGSVTRNGRAVDWISASTPALADRAREALAEVAPPAGIVEADAASTAAVEAEWKRNREAPAEPSDGRWVRRDAGLRLAIPAGWTTKEVHGVEVLVDGAAVDRGRFATNINLVVLPVAAGDDLDALLAQNRAALAAAADTVLVSMEKASFGGVPAVRYEFHGVIVPNLPPLRCLGAIYIHDGRQVVVTGTATHREWDTQGPVLRAAFEGAKVEGSTAAR